jgi:HSP20 family protein
MNIVRWDPFRELEEMSGHLNRILGQPARRADEEPSFLADWVPAVDIQETDKAYIIKADLPEVKKENVQVSVQDGLLTLQGERMQEKEESGKKFRKTERSYGKFVRRFAVPDDVDTQKVSAEFKEGVLNVQLPKAPSAKPRAIEVKVA